MTSGEKNHEGKDQEKSIPIVGLGASAGGLKALQEFFSHVPADSGLAYVVIVHLSPEHKSMLAELLQPFVKIPVTQVTNHVLIERNHVYVIPPNANLNTIDTHLRLSDLEEKRSERAPIDHFFRTLANTHGDNAAGVVLTGTGSDGSIGLKDIKEKGGITLVQDPEEADHDGMPQSALSTGMVDKVLLLKDLPAYLMNYFATTPKIKTLARGKADQNEVKLINKVLAKVKLRTGRDFSQYKLSTLMRRLQRRMQLYQVEKLEEYMKILEKDNGEAIRLSDDFLINVTSFFRDEKVFNYLEKKIIPHILDIKSKDESVRIWSIGCATGEEAYSLAMVFQEASSRLEIAPAIQVFASDLHEDSLTKAREGFYPGDINVDVPEERLRRYFQKENGGYRIRKEIREMVVFTPHNLLSDPPFSKLDLVLCRNLLIYLKAEVQKDILELLHYSLEPSGYLLLGSAERVENFELFALQEKDLAVFTKRNVASPEPKLPVFSSSFPIQHENNKTDEEGDLAENLSKGQLHQQIVEKLGPPSILLNQDGRVLHVSQNAGRYLKIYGGEISNDIYDLLPEGLQTDLRTAIFSSRGKMEIVRSRPRMVKLEGRECQLVLSVRSIRDQNRQAHYLVMFEEYDKPVAPEEIKAGEGEIEESGEKLKLLEDELKDTRERLQSIIEEYETSREEMKASNEELQSSNEELRSTLEELETSKEELQSLNEELITMNQENRHKVQELNLLSDDLQNFMAATDIASLFLDRDLRIMRYTPKLEELFNVRPVDKGRPISDQTHNLQYDDLERDARKSLKTLQVVEKEVNDLSGNTYLSRILPYRSAEDKIGGVVITFVDITSRKSMEEQLRKSEERMKALVNTGFDLIYRMNHDWSEMLELEGRGFLSDTTKPRKGWMEKYIPREDHEKVRKGVKKAMAENMEFDLKHRVILANGDIGWCRSRAIAIKDQQGKIVEWFGAAVDVTKDKQSEENLQKAKREAEKAARMKDDFLAHMSHEIRTPMNVITGLTQLLLDHDPRKDQVENLKTLNRVAKNLGTIINDILDFSKVKSGKIALEKESFSVETLLKEIVSLHKVSAREKKIKLDWSLDDAVFDTICTDRAKMASVLHNLLSNAVKFTNKGKVTLNVKLEREEENHQIIRFTVADTGIGIPEKIREQIFDVFRQGDSSTIRKYGGTGLGLSIVKIYLQMMGSEIELDSQVGQGSRFSFAVRVPEGIAAPVKEEQQTPEGDLKGMSILLVEDDQYNLMMIAQFLDQWGVDYHLAENGIKAIDLAARNGYDIILMDIRMPEMDGFTATKRIRKINGYEETCIIALTADVSESVKKEISSGLFSDAFIKPVNPNELKAKLLKYKKE